MYTTFPYVKKLKTCFVYFQIFCLCSMQMYEIMVNIKEIYLFIFPPSFTSIQRDSIVRDALLFIILS